MASDRFRAGIVFRIVSLILAIILRERGAVRTVLYEATTKKCSFLNEAAVRTGAPVEIRNGRIEKPRPSLCPRPASTQ